VDTGCSSLAAHLPRESLMPRALRWLFPCGTACILACQDFTPPPIQTGLTIGYPAQVEADFPHHNPGDTVEVNAIVTRDGLPAAGIEVVWEDGFVIPAVRPSHSYTDQGGRTSARWTLRPLGEGQFSRHDSIAGYVPGARNSPIRYRVWVIECTRCPPEGSLP